MTIDETIVRAYLQSAHDRGGGWEMAMNMMADRLLVLEDRLLRAGVDFPPDPRFKGPSPDWPAEAIGRIIAIEATEAP